jgi:hypothetical protein
MVLHAQTKMKRMPQLEDKEGNGPAWWFTTAAQRMRGYHHRSGARIADLASSYGDSGHSTTCSRGEKMADEC